jgi:hypothetical protein
VSRPAGVIFALVAIALASSGCGVAPADAERTAKLAETPGSRITPAASASDDKTIIEDRGRIIAGTILRHSFTVLNDLDETLSIKGKEDIQKICGCAGLEPGKTILEPGEETAVTVTVHTLGKSGLLANGGSIVWTGQSGRKRKTTLLIKAQAIPPLYSEPEVVSFSESQIRGKIAKPVRLRANTTVDWTTIRFSGGSTAVEISNVRHEREEAWCDVRFSPTAELEAFADQVCVQIRGQDAGGEGGNRDYAIAIPLRAQQAVDFSIAPKPATVLVTHDGNARTRLVVRGERLSLGANTIQRITCEGYRVDWKLSEVSKAKVAVLEVNLTRLEGFAGEVGETLAIGVAGIGEIRLPFVSIRSSAAQSKG